MRGASRNSGIAPAAAFAALAVGLALASLAQAAPRRVFLRMLVAPGAGQMRQAIARLDQGEPFREVARDLSSDPSAERGGYLGEMLLDQMNDAFRQALRGVEPGERSQPFRLGSRHIILFRMPEGFRARAIELGEKADALLEQGAIEQALEKYQEAVEIWPEYIHGYFKLGVAWGKAGQPSKEAQAYLRAIEIEPEYRQAHYNLGVLMQSQGRHGEAVQAFQRSLGIDPNQAFCHVNLSSSYLAMGRRREAIESARKAVEIDPLLPEAYFNLGVAYGEGAPEKALESFRTAAALDPANPDYRVSQAIALTHLGDFAAAREILSQVLRENPGFDKARRSLEQLDRIESESQRAAAQAPPPPAPKAEPEAAPPAAEAHPTQEAPDAEALAAKARQRLGQGDFQGALALYDRAVRQEPANQEYQYQRAWALVALGKALQSQGQWEKAIEAWEEALVRYPDFVPALASLARAAIVQGRFSAAEEALRRARRQEPSNPELIILRSRLDYERRNLEEAFARLEQLDLARLEGRHKLLLLEQLTYLDLDEQAIKLFRNLGLPEHQMLEAVNHLVKADLFEEAERWLKANPSPYGQALLGKVYAAQLRFEEAEQVLRDLARRAPEAWSAHYFLGQAYASAGEAGKAIEEFKTALRLQPRNVNVYYQLGRAAAQAGRSEDARQWLRQGLELSPSSFQLNFEMGQLLLDQGEPEAALPYLRRVLESEPDHVRTHYLLGRLYQQRGQREEARRYFSRFQELKKRLEAGRQRLLAEQRALKGRTLIP